MNQNEDSVYSVEPKLQEILDENNQLMKFDTLGNFITRPIKKFFKFLIRKTIGWYVEPGLKQNKKTLESILESEKRTVSMFTNIKQDVIQKSEELATQHQAQSEELSHLKQDFEQYKPNLDPRATEMIKTTTDFQIYEYNTKLQDQLTYYEGLIAGLQTDFNKMRERVNNIAPEFRLFSKSTFSQSGEDSIVLYILTVLGIPYHEATYLDLGANHPIEMSNTYLLYSLGAHGVLVEGNADLIPALEAERPNDTTLNFAVADRDDDVITFYVLNGDGLSSTNKANVDDVLAKNSDLKIVEAIEMKTITPSKILNEYFKNAAPTVMSIDIEGEEFNIINNIDFKLHRPMIIIMEMIEYDTALAFQTKNRKLLDKMDEVGYFEYAFTGINSVFIDKKALNKK